MAILYSEYKKKYGDIINVRRKAQQAYEKSQQTSKDAKKEYEKIKTARLKIRDNLVNYYQNKGVLVSNGGILPTPLSSAVEAPKFQRNENGTNSLIGPANLNNRYKALENIKKFDEITEQPNVQSQRNRLENQYFQEGESYLNYLNKKLEEDDIGWYDKTIGRVVAPIISRFTSVPYIMKNENGDTYSMPTYEDLKQQKVLDSYGDGFWGTVGKISASALYEGGKLATSAALNALIPGAGTASYFGNIYFNQWNNAVAEGYSKEQALAYATLSTATEAVTSKILGGTTNAIFGTGTSELSQSIANGLSKFIQNNPTLVNGISNAISEGGEEFIQEYVDVLTRNLTLGEDNKIFTQENFENALFSAAVGSLTGGVSGVFSPSTNINNQQEKAQVNQFRQNPNVNLPTINKYSLPTYNQNTENTIVNDAVNSRVNQNNINLSKINQGQTQNAINSNSTNNQNSITSKIKKISKWALDKVGNLKPFKQQLIEYETKQLPSGTQLVVSDNSKGLAYANFSDNPIVINQTNVEKIVNGKHSNIPRNIIENIDTELNNSVFAMDSRTVDNAKIVVLDAIDTDGNPIIASLTQDKKSGKIVVNELTSVYEKRDFQNYINRTIEDGKNIYTNEKTEQWLPRRGLQLPTRFTTDSVSYNNNSTNTVQSQIAPLPLNNMHNNQSNILNPLEISQLTPEDANTTPILPNLNRNRVNDGESRFASNIRNKTNMLNEQQKNTILADEEVNYYDTITNEDSLNEAFSRLNENGETETLNWFSRDSESATAVDVAEGWILLKQYADNNDSDGMVAIAKKLRDMGTKAGQTVQAFNIMARMTPEGMVKYAQSELMEAYDRMIKNKTKKWIEQHQKDFDLTPQETSAIMEIMKKVSTMPDGYEKRVELAKIQKIMTDKLPPERGAGIKSWMRISMLFNPKTQIRNVAGNAIIAPVNSFSDLFASMADKVIGSKTGYRTTGVTNIQKYVKGMKEGLYQSYNDFKQGINTRNIQGNRFEIGEGKSFNNNTAIGKSLNRVDSLLSFMLDAGDRMFYEASFTNSINNQLVLNNTTEVTQEMIDIATQEALSRTWQDNNNYTRFVLNVRKMLNNVNVRGYGLGDVLIPFAKTPANLTKAIVDYSPAGLVNTLVKGKRLKNAIETGQFTPQMQHDFVQTLGKATVGTMLYVAGYALAKAGIVSGESDDDKDVRDFMKNTLGINSYSIKIGNKSFTYDWMQPIAAPLSIMANIVQKEDEDANTLETILSSLDTAGNILLEQSFMESINTALNNNDGLASGVQEAIFDLPARAIPTFMKQIADRVDGTQRTSFEYGKPLESAINSVKAKIPFLSKTLAPSVDSMGREIQKYGGKNNVFNVFFNPANVSTENISKSAAEIYRLYQETGDTTIMPRVAPYYINKNGEKITLNSSQRTAYQKTSGSIIEEEVQKLLNSSEYGKLTDEEKSSVIGDIVNYSYNMAQKEVLGTEVSQTYQKAYEYSQIGNIGDYYTFVNSVDDSSKESKRNSIVSFLTSSNLSDKEIAALYSKYYSSEEKLNDIITLRIPIKEYIKLDSQEFTTDYKNGKAVTNSKKNKLIKYVNSLNLSIPQKAYLIKSQYSSYDSYNKEIVSYVNSQSISKFEKASILKTIGFDNWNRYLIDEIKALNISEKEKIEMLEELGFKVIDGRIYK